MKIQTYKIKNDEIAVFDPESLKIWKTSAEVVSKSEKYLTDAGACEDLFGEAVNHPVLIREETVKENEFDTLVLHIANSCNMQCEYCYESHSTYISAPGMMSIETAIRTLNLYYSRYSYIREIKFFGGEPALNQPVIEAVCDYIGKLYTQGSISKKPVFKIITNGTIMNQEFIHLIRKYQIKVVFSIDGDALLHDQLRVYPKKKETFAVIYKNFFVLREATEDKQPYSINATYTGIHEQAGLTINDLLWKLSDLFPVAPKKINVHLVTADPPLPYSIKGKDNMRISAEDALVRAENGDCRTHTRLRAVIRRLKKGGPLTESPCPAAVAWSAVSHTGNVYPCMMFIDRQDCYMGNVRDDIFFLDEYKKVKDRFHSVKKSDHERCNQCMAKHVCASCMGINEFESGDIFPRSKQSCNEYRKIVETAVKGIAEGVW